MNETKSFAKHYFQSYQNYFWQWEVDSMFRGSAVYNEQPPQSGINSIGVPGGMTIAYKDQIAEVLQLIAPIRIPPFGSLLLTFLATNTNTGDVTFMMNSIFKSIIAPFEKFTVSNHIHFSEAQKFLNILIALPEYYKTGKRRLDLFAFLFSIENYTLAPKYTEEILLFIKNESSQLNECSEKTTLTASALGKDINILAHFYSLYQTQDALLDAWLKIDTVSIEPEVSESENFTDNPNFVQELIDDPKTFYMGSLIKRIWSGVQLPMHYALPGEMPLGGISDISNKGKFDNILVSEFANEDLIFLHRIANKEALFIRRETTPEEDVRSRIFLIDTTIKNWGTPKILSMATAFSLMHHPKNDFTFQPYALGETYTEMNFQSKTAIIDNLQLTSASLDAANALQLFLDECEEEHMEITFFTTPKTLEHATIRSIFNAHSQKFSGVITSDASGTIEVFSLKNGAKSLSKKILLPLKELWDKSSTKHQNKLKNVTQEEVEKLKNYPLLYGPPGRMITQFSDADTLYVLTKNGELFKSDAVTKGFSIIQKNIHFVKQIKQQLLATIYNQELVVLFWNAKSGMVFKTETETYTFYGNYQSFKQNYYKSLFVYDDELYFATKRNYSDDGTFLKFSLKKNVFELVQRPSSELSQIYKDALIRRYRQREGSIFRKIHSVTVTTDYELIFNYKHKLVIEHNSIRLELLNDEIGVLEYEYTEHSYDRYNNVFFTDGSHIQIDKNGMLTFLSENEEIPTFYMTCYIGIPLAMATDVEFAGDTFHYKDEEGLRMIGEEAFKENYLLPFLKNILGE